MSLDAAPVIRGVEHQLEPAFIKVAYWGTAGWLLFSTPVYVGALTLTQVYAPVEAWMKWALWGLFAAKLAFNIAKGYLWPRISYRHARYMIDDDGLQIRSGVLTRVVTSVPRSRVQHVDVAQNIW